MHLDTVKALALSAVLVIAGADSGRAGAIHPDGTDRDCTRLNLAAQNTVVTRWNLAALEAICAGRPLPTVVARELFLLHAAIFDAWAAYDETARPLYWEGFVRRPAAERSAAAKSEAISFAALEVLLELYPDHAVEFLDRLHREGFDDRDFLAPPPGSPARIGIAAAGAVLDRRAGDGANSAGGYADISGYRPANAPDAGLGDIDPNRWQPLVVTDFDPARRPTGFVLDPQRFDPEAYGRFAPQMFVTPHWAWIEPFALDGGDQLRPPPPPQYGNHEPYIDARGRQTTYHQAYIDQFDEVMEMQAALTDEQMIIAQVWSHDGPYFAAPSGHWNHFAQQISLRDRHGTDDDVKLFLALNGALLDASIAAWDAKIAYDSVRPITAIRFLHRGHRITGWQGRDHGIGPMRGEDWIPYQWTAWASPAFPEYVSGHSTFAAAAAEVLRLFTGSDRFYDPAVRVGDLDRDRIREPVGSYVVRHRYGAFDRAIPVNDVTLRWDTFTAAAEQCGLSRLYAGVHITDANLRALAMGRIAGAQAYRRAERLWQGEGG
ncbi:MAG TPA: vanadium-dependent haloperoxidase [Alphaproteobacteria bacterium]